MGKEFMSKINKKVNFMSNSESIEYLKYIKDKKLSLKCFKRIIEM